MSMRNIQMSPYLPFSVPPIQDITDLLPRKKTWEQLTDRKWVVRGKWDGKTYAKGFRNPEDVTCIVVHHSGPPNGTLESHARYHADRWGARIAYHICIDKGRIYQTNDLLSMTYHAGNNNTYTIGIEVNRDLTGNDLTDEERRLLYAAILTVKSLFPTINEIKGHRELPTAATSCPQTNEDRIRADIASLWAQMEEQQTYNGTLSASRVLAFATAERVFDLKSKLNNPTWGEAARAKLMWLAPAMESISKASTAAELIAKDISDLYDKAQSGKFQDEATRKLLVVAAAAKEKGLL